MHANNDSIIFILSTDFVIDFEAPEYTVSENGGSVSVCLRTSTGNAEPVTVVFSTRHVTTSGNSSKNLPYLLTFIRIYIIVDGDYRTISQVIIPASPGSSRVCVDIPIVDDTIVENTEDFIVTFEGPPGTSGTTTFTRVVIVDNDCEPIIMTLYCTPPLLVPILQLQMHR